MTDEMLAHLIRACRENHLNFVFDYVYDFAPGKLGYNAAFYRSTSRAGILSSLTMPHVSNFNFKLEDPARAAEYRRVAEHQLRRYQNLPGVVMYAASHNAVGYSDQQNPERIGHRSSGKTGISSGLLARRNQALKCEAIIRSMDSTRPVYHHSSGNIGNVYTVNCYLNWAPRQERSDWLERWEKQGDMPLFFIEYGAPHVASYTSCRGPGFLWDSAFNELHWQWFDEYNAAVLGSAAYQTSSAKQTYYRAEEKAVKGNRTNYAFMVHFVKMLPDVQNVMGAFIRENMRMFRARGLSGCVVWDYEAAHRRTGREIPCQWNPDRFKNLKRSALVNDICSVSDGGWGCNWNYLTDPYAKYELTSFGMAIEEGRRDILAFIAGTPDNFSEKSHSFYQGETLRKSLMIVNDTRRPQTILYTWSIPGLTPERSGTVTVAAGGRNIVPVQSRLNRNGRFELRVKFHFPDNHTEEDRFPFDAFSPEVPVFHKKIALFDPENASGALFKTLNLPVRPVHSEADLEGTQILVIGRNALGKLPFSLTEYTRKGGNCLILEQNQQILGRIGFRTTAYGLRTLFPVGEGLRNSKEPIHNWRGSATSVPPYSPAKTPPDYPEVFENGFRNRHIWRCGNRGSVASILPERPSIGNFLPLYQGGFDLQYTPVMEFREKGTVVIFSQLDLSGRTENEPEAGMVLSAMLKRLDRAQPSGKERKTWYQGDSRLIELLQQLNITASPLTDGQPGPGELLILGPGSTIPKDLSSRIRAGLNIIPLGLSGAELRKIDPTVASEIGTWFSNLATPEREPLFAGITNAELHTRWANQYDAFPSQSAGGRSLGIRRIGRGNLVMLQLPSWAIDPKEQALRTTRRKREYLASRLLFNLGAQARTGLLSRLDKLSPETATALDGDWEGREDPSGIGRREQWFRSGVSFPRRLKSGLSFEQQIPDLKKYDGFFWYRKVFPLKPSWCERKSELRIGGVDDESWVWLNGRFLGEITQKTNPKNYWLAPRTYRLNPGDLRVTNNELIILCRDLRDEGGLMNVPELVDLNPASLYVGRPIAVDDPYRYFHW